MSKDPGVWEESAILIGMRAVDTNLKFCGAV